MAVRGGPIKNEEYSDLKVSAGEGASKKNEKGYYEISIGGDTEPIDALDIVYAIDKRPISLFVRKGGYADCHWSDHNKALWVVQVIDPRA